MTDARIPPPLPPQPLDYRGRPGERIVAKPGFDLPPAQSSSAQRAASIFSLVRLITTISVLAIMLIVFFLVIPRLETVYADFGTKLPWITQLVLDVSRFLHTPLGWVVAFAIAGIIAVTMAVLPIPRRWLRLLVVVMLALITISLALAVLLPIVNLMDSISSGKK